MILIGLLFLIYLFTITLFIISFDKVKEFISKKNSPNTKFTVIIPFRNESKNLPQLLTSIKSLKYPSDLVEYILIDDDSNDNSVSIIENYLQNNNVNFQILKNERHSNSPKKDAITTALKTSSNQWIITTDADCILPNSWLNTFDNFITANNCNLIVAPVTYSTNNSFLHQFQLLDFLSLQASTISSFGLNKPFLCNGANLAYKKEVFNKVNGFENNNSIASGDDIFVLEKFLKLDKQKVAYLKSTEVIVKTLPVSTFNQLIHQRVRWASKTANYSLFLGQLIGLIIMLGNTTIVILPLLIYFKIISNGFAITCFFLKLFFDYLLLQKIEGFFELRVRFLNYLISSFLYPFFTLIVVLKALFSNYQWKGRSFRK